MEICIFSLLIEKQKDKEVFTGYYLTGEKRLLLLEFLPLRLRTPLFPQLLTKVKQKPKRVQKMR